MVKEKRPNLIFLIETKLHNKNLDYLRIRLKFDHLFMVDSVGVKRRSYLDVER
jgi:hypothetical protein